MVGIAGGHPPECLVGSLARTDAGNRIAGLLAGDRQANVFISINSAKQMFPFPSPGDSKRFRCLELDREIAGTNVLL
jgi:hypothetical protein